MSDRLICEWCGSEFDRPAVKGRVPLYCSNSHRQRAHEQRRLARALADKDAEIVRLKAKLRKVARSR
jgi:uncharacterized protein YprB with RNaseH-like and TPR domain